MVANEIYSLKLGIDYEERLRILAISSVTRIL